MLNPTKWNRPRDAPCSIRKLRKAPAVAPATGTLFAATSSYSPMAKTDQFTVITLQSSLSNQPVYTKFLSRFETYNDETNN